MAGDKQEIEFTLTRTGAEADEVNVTPSGVAHSDITAVYNQVTFTAWPLPAKTGELTYGGAITFAPELAVGSGTGILETADGVFLTKWHYKQHVSPLEPFALKIVGVGIGELEGLWFEVTAEDLSPYAPYTCKGLLMNPKAAK